MDIFYVSAVVDEEILPQPVLIRTPLLHCLEIIEGNSQLIQCFDLCFTFLCWRTCATVVIHLDTALLFIKPAAVCFRR